MPEACCSSACLLNSTVAARRRLQELGLLAQSQYFLVQSSTVQIMIQEEDGDEPRNVPFKGVNQVNLMQGIHGQHVEKICEIVLGFETNVQGDLVIQLNL